MKKFALLLITAAFTLWAADFWQSKAYTDWNEKDIQKILTDSPWAKKVNMPLEGGFGGGPAGGGIAESAGGGRGGRGGGGGGGGDAAPAPISEGGGRGGRGGGGGGADIPGGGASLTAAVQLIIRWQTALPVKQALVKAKYGSEAANSAEGKQFLARTEQFYVIDLAGIPGNVLPRDQAAKEALVKASTLSAKDKNSVVAAEIQADAPSGRNAELYFLFPRSTMFTADDKEVEFATKLGKTALKAKFRLKDMVINGKLDL